MYRIGEKVVCVRDSEWNDGGGAFNGTLVGPVPHEICEITYIARRRCQFYFCLKGYPEKNGYRMDNFKKLDRAFADRVIAEIYKRRHINSR